MTTTLYDFDTVYSRRGTYSAKHDMFPDDVLPMWVADMDFQSPPEVIAALRQRINHGFFGYTMPPEELNYLLVERMALQYDWKITPEDLVFIPGVIPAFNYALRVAGDPGNSFLIKTPAYPPILRAQGGISMSPNQVELIRTEHKGILRYEIDFDALENTINEQTKAFLLCSPHNPVGRVWSRDELTRMAEICEKHDLLICSDEIHCEILHDNQHIPIATLSPEIARRTLTLMAPSKTFNLAGLHCSFAIIQDENLRERFNAAKMDTIPGVDILAYTAALTAYRDGGEWRRQLLTYLKVNRDYLVNFVRKNLPRVSITQPEGTYLAWLDCREYITPEYLAQSDEESHSWIDPFFLNEAKVALNDGRMFGEPGIGYARINFACPRSMLVEGLNRIQSTLERIGSEP